jgi:hypothetical protein
MCHPGVHHGHTGMQGCGCMSHGPHLRHFTSSKEVQEHLESYKEHLEKELAGVEERIGSLKKKQEE